jgi:hypothetical protein
MSRTSFFSFFDFAHLAFLAVSGLRRTLWRPDVAGTFEKPVPGTSDRPGRERLSETTLPQIATKKRRPKDLGFEVGGSGGSLGLR